MSKCHDSRFKLLAYCSLHQSAIGIAVESWPATLGCEGAGTVEDVGPGVQGFKKGDEVFSRLDPQVPESAAFQV